MSSKAYLAKFVTALSGVNEYLVLDTETTGFQNTGEVVQIAIINNRGDVLLDTLVKPSRPIPAKAAAVHGITDAMVKDAPVWADVARTVAKLITSKRKPLVVYNVQFDRQILYNSDKFGQSVLYGWDELPSSWLCAMNAFAPHYGKWNNRRRSYTWQPLSTAARILNIKVTDAHSALGDCWMTLGVTEALLGKYANK